MYDFTGKVFDMHGSCTIGIIGSNGANFFSFKTQDDGVGRILQTWMSLSCNSDPLGQNYKEDLRIGDTKFYGCFPTELDGQQLQRNDDVTVEVTMSYDKFEVVDNTEVYTLVRHGATITYEVRDKSVTITMDTGVVKTVDKETARQMWKIDKELGFHVEDTTEEPTDEPEELIKEGEEVLIAYDTETTRKEVLKEMQDYTMKEWKMLYEGKFEEIENYE